MGGNDLLRYVPLLETSQGTMEDFLSSTKLENHLEILIRACLKKSGIKLQKLISWHLISTTLSGRYLQTGCLCLNLNSLNQASRIAIDLFNKAIRDFYKSDELISLSSVCTDKKHFANPIEPSTLGSKSIAESIYKHFALN